MNTQEVIRPEYVFLNEPLRTKDGALSFVADRALELGITNDAAGLLADLEAREKQMATGLERGFAIPHAKSDKVLHAAVIYVSLDKELVWGSFEGELMVRRMFALLVPKDQNGDPFIELLSKLAVALLDKEFCTQIEQADSPELVCRLIQERIG